MDQGKLIRGALGAAVLVAGVPAAAASGNPASSTGTGKVIVLSPISFITIEELRFGDVILPSSSNGTVTIDANTGAASYSNLDHSTALAATTQRGRFIGSGSANQVVYVTTTLPTILEKFPGGPSVAASLNLDRAPDGAGNYVYTVDPVSLTFEVGVGGTLTVPPTAELGAYSASFDVTATYQ